MKVRGGWDKFGLPKILSGPASSVRAIGRPRHQTGRMNKQEQAYALFLEEKRAANLIQWWGFEVVKIRLADATFYAPDFLVVAADGELQVHEVKAWWKTIGGPHWEDDARAKIKVAAETFPAAFRGVCRAPDGEWKVELF